MGETTTASWGWALLAALLLVDALWLAASDFRLVWSSLAAPALSVATLVAAAWIFRRRRGNEAAFALLDSIAQVIGCFALCGALSYLVLAGDRPLVDPALAGIDAALGFKWAGFVGWVQAHPLLDRLLAIAYDSTMVQLVAIALLLFARQPGRVRELSGTAMIALVITIMASSLLPAVSAYPYYGPAHPEIRPEIWVDDLVALRDGSLRTLDLAHMEGLVSCPSFHAILSLLFIRALRGRRWLFAAGLALNLAVLVSTLTAGGHYLVDLPAGGAVTVVSIMLYRGLQRRTAARPTPRMFDKSNAILHGAPCPFLPD